MVNRITKAVQITPFVYSLIVTIVFSLYNVLGDNVLDLLDEVFYISPLVIVIFLVYSRILHLCKWHRITCVIPLLPKAVYFVDSFYELTQNEVLLANITSLSMAILLLVSAYKVFFGCKKN